MYALFSPENLAAGAVKGLSAETDFFSSNDAIWHSRLPADQGIVTS